MEPLDFRTVLLGLEYIYSIGENLKFKHDLLKKILSRILTGEPNPVFLFLKEECK